MQRNTEIVRNVATNLCHQLNIKLPIIQAPMAGGLVPPTLIAEVTKSGGLGSLSLGYLSISEARQAIQQITAISSGAFAANVFIPTPKLNLNHQQIERMFKYVNRYRAQLGLPALINLPSWTEPDIDELLDMVISEGVSIISITFGVLNKDTMARLHKNNIFVIGTATTVQEALALEEAGCDAVVAQGYEAGGHRGGGFLANDPGGLIGTMVLVPQMVDALSIPIIAAGGIMDGRGIAAALLLGASAVQLGTAFLTCDESNASPMHKRMILQNAENSTCITSAFTGKPVRSFNNQFIATIEKNFRESELPSYPLQHQLTKELRSNANKLNRFECAGLWSGQGTRLSRSLSVAKLISELQKETSSALSHLKQINTLFS